jgi:hypothetical protein
MPVMDCWYRAAFGFRIYGISKELKIGTEDLVTGRKVYKAL